MGALMVMAVMVDMATDMAVQIATVAQMRYPQQERYPPLAYSMTSADIKT